MLYTIRYVFALALGDFLKGAISRPVETEAEAKSLTSGMLAAAEVVAHNHLNQAKAARQPASREAWFEEPLLVDFSEIISDEGS